MTDVPPALSLAGRNIDTHQLDTGPHLSWDGKVPAEQTDRLYNRLAERLRKEYPFQLLQVFAVIFDFYDR